MSAATSWCLGNDAGKALILDDFKVYQGSVTLEQARQLYAGEAVPNGIYNISLCADNEEFVHPYEHSITAGTPLEILKKHEGGEKNVYKWVIFPWADSLYVSGFRILYTGMDMHIAGNQAQQSARVDIDEHILGHIASYQWRVEPAGDGYFFIKSQADRTKYLHPVSHSFSESTRLEILDYNAGYAPLYKWKFNLIKTNYEMKHGPLKDEVTYEVVLSDNPFLGMTAVGPIVERSVPVFAARSPYPSLLNYWKFHTDWDDSYSITNSSLYNLYLQPENGSISEHNPIRSFPLESENLSSYLFVVEKPNKYGRRVVLKQAYDQDFIVTAVNPVSNKRLTLEKKDKLPYESLQWALFAQNAKSPNANNQIYDLKPGIYRIVSVKNPNKSITTTNYQWSETSNLVLKNTTYYNRYTSHYWVVDYERDNNGNPVLDGTYTIQLFGTDKYYIHTKAHSLDNYANLEIYRFDRDHLDSEKWFIKPTRDGSGSYFIRLAGDQGSYIHLTNNTSEEDNALEILWYDESHPDSYKWKFEPVSVIAPFATGIHKVVTQKDQTKFLHVKGHSTDNEAHLEILSYNASFDNIYKWKFIKQEDNTYMIQNVGSSRYVHPIEHSTAEGTRLQQLDYNSSFAPYYKWIITTGSEANTYKIYSVADPNLLIHLSGHTAEESNEVEILNYNSSHPWTYDWKLQQ